MNVSPRFHRSYALSGRLGQGHFFFFQLVLDKIDGTQETLGRRQCMLFFDRLLAHVSGWPRVGRKPAARSETNGRPPQATPVPQGPPPRYRLRSRIFWDDNGNGRFDGRDRPASDLTVRVGDQRLVTDAQGRFEVVLSNGEDHQISLDLSEEARWDATWFWNLRAGEARRDVLHRDWPVAVQPAPASQQGRILMASLPGTLSAATLARMELALERLLGEEPCSLVILLSPILDGRQLGDLYRRLAAVCRRSKVGLRVLAPAPERGAGPMRHILGPSRFGFLRGQNRLLLAAERESATWLKSEAEVDGGRVFAALCAQDPGFEARRALSATVRHLVLPMLSREEDEDKNTLYLAPILLMDGENEEEARCAGFRVVNAALTWFRSPPAARMTPVLPIHPLGKGDLDAMLEGKGP